MTQLIKHWMAVLTISLAITILITLGVAKTDIEVELKWVAVAIADTLIEATAVIYDTTLSQLNSTNIQAGIDEVVQNIKTSEQLLEDQRNTLANWQSSHCPTGMQKLGAKVCVDTNLQISGGSHSFYNAMLGCDGLPTKRRLCTTTELVLACDSGLITDHTTLANKWEWSATIGYDGYTTLALYSDCNRTSKGSFSHSGVEFQYRCCLDI